MTPAEKLAAKLRESPPVEAGGHNGAAICCMAEIREQLGLKQVDVAGAVGISGGYLSFLESGQRWPPLLLAVKLARFYGKKIEELWELPPEVQE